MELPLHSVLSLYNARLIAGLLFSVHNVHYYFKHGKHDIRIYKL